MASSSLHTLTFSVSSYLKVLFDFNLTSNSWPMGFWILWLILGNCYSTWLLGSKGDERSYFLSSVTFPIQICIFKVKGVSLLCFHHNTAHSFLTHTKLKVDRHTLYFLFFFYFVVVNTWSSKSWRYLAFPVFSSTIFYYTSYLKYPYMYFRTATICTIPPLTFAFTQNSTMYSIPWRSWRIFFCTAPKSRPIVRVGDFRSSFLEFHLYLYFECILPFPSYGFG